MPLRRSRETFALGVSEPLQLESACVCIRRLKQQRRPLLNLNLPEVAEVLGESTTGGPAPLRQSEVRGEAQALRLADSTDEERRKQLGHVDLSSFFSLPPPSSCSKT